MSLDKIIEYLQIDTQETRRKKGQASGTTFTLTQDAMPTFIDFTHLGLSINVPANTNMTIPGELLYSLEIINIGSGTLYYSVNLPYNEGGSIAMLNGSSRLFESKVPKYKSVTLRAVGANCTVNIGIEI